MYSASVENKGDSRYYAATKDYSFVIDTAGQGANPIDTLLAGLCGCIGHWVGDYIRGERIDAGGFTVKAEAGLTSGRDRLSDINMVIEMKDARLDGRHGEELLKYVENCAIYNTLKANSRIRIILAGQTPAGQ
jgi:uncharacterized OsmC-like protein